MASDHQPTGGRWTVARRLERLATVLVVVSLLPVLVAVGIPTLARLRGERLLLVVSGSMTPTFAAGEVVRIHPVSAGALRPGMVVTFRPPGGLTLQTHRIASLEHLATGDYIQTKGDANASADPDFTPVANVIGQLDGDVGVFGPFLARTQTRPGRVAVFGTPLLLLALAQLLSLADRARRADDVHLDDLDFTDPGHADPGRADPEHAGADITDRVSDGHLNPSPA